MQVAGAWARSQDRFAGADFTLIDERTLKCPAEKLMYRREVRQNRQGDLLILFGINPHHCQQCPLKAKCLADGAKGTAGRRVTVIRKKLGTPSTQPVPVIEHQPVPVSPATTGPTLPVFWLDFPTTRLRRDLTHQLHKHQIVIEAIPGNLPSTPPKPSFITCSDLQL
jgi:hypothetical protein